MQTPELRLARRSDAEQISALMRASILTLFPRCYDERQTASAAVYVARFDVGLVDDGTYFVHEAGGKVVACGGWSRRGKLYAGSADAEDDDRPLDPEREAAHVRAMFVRGDWTRRGLGRAILGASEDAARDAGFHALDLMATLPGVPLYQAYGFREVSRREITLPDGVALQGVAMEKPIALRRRRQP